MPSHPPGANHENFPQENPRFEIEITTQMLIPLLVVEGHNQTDAKITS